MSTDAERARFLEGLARAARRPWKLNEATRLALDGFAQRYAAERGLSHDPTGRTPPATWFLETVSPAKSHSFLRGPLAGGPPGELFYAERAVAVKRGHVMEGWTVARYELPDAAAVAYGIACVFRPGPAWRGRIRPPAVVPRGLTEVPLEDDVLDERFLIAVTEDDRPALQRLFSAAFIAWLNEQPWQRDGEQVTRFELRGGVLCVYARPKARTALALDAFCERAARIAERVGEVAER